MTCLLVAIARNEERALVEWLAHHLVLGFDRIVVYDHGSTDRTGAMLRAIGRHYPVSGRAWSADPSVSPQVAAYNHALRRFAAEADWLAFFDLDEFLVLRDPAGSVGGWLAGMAEDVGAVGVNWLTFGSSGRERADYGLVRDGFRTGGARGRGNNKHIKTLARPAAMRRMRIHDCELASGRYVTPSGQPLVFPTKPGIAAAVEHEVAQLNHYQVKSREEFAAKIARGRAGKAADDPTRIRENPESLFSRLDDNSVAYDDIDANRDAFLRVYADLLSVCLV